MAEVALCKLHVEGKDADLPTHLPNGLLLRFDRLSQRANERPHLRQRCIFTSLALVTLWHSQLQWPKGPDGNSAAIANAPGNMIKWISRQLAVDNLQFTVNENRIPNLHECQKVPRSP